MRGIGHSWQDLVRGRFSLDVQRLMFAGAVSHVLSHVTCVFEESCHMSAMCHVCVYCIQLENVAIDSVRRDASNACSECILFVFSLTSIFDGSCHTSRDSHIYTVVHHSISEHARTLLLMQCVESCHKYNVIWVMSCYEYLLSHVVFWVPSRHDVMSRVVQKKNATGLSRMSNNVLSHVTSIIDDTCHMWVISRFNFFVFFFSRPFDMLTQCFETCLICYRWDISYVSHVISIFIFVHSTSQCVHILTDLFFAGVVQSHSMIGVTNCKRLWRCV